MSTAPSNHSIKWTDEQQEAIFGFADSKLIAAFKAFHEKNPAVYAMFFDKANTIRASGREKYSQWRITHAITWDMDIKTTGDCFKINNDFIACYARLLIWHHPIFDGFFELRTMKPYRRETSSEQRTRSAAKSYEGEA